MTRLHGAVDSAAGAVPFGHMGWGFRDRAEFLTAAGEYIADGLRQHQLVAYVDEAVRRYLDTAEDAVARGYTGFRAVVDVTSVARTVGQRDALAQLEFRVDQQMAILPFSALCAYNVAELGPAAAEVICLHPFVNADAVGFQLFADPMAAMSFVLTGELDSANRSAFAATLERIWPLSDGDTLDVDATGLSFIDHRSLMLLDGMARRHRQSVALHTGAPVAARLIELLELSAVSVVGTSTREAGA